MYKIDQALCTGCGLCLDACQAGAIAVVDGWAQIDDAACIDCGSCARVCPQGAILLAEAYPMADAYPVAVTGADAVRPAPVVVVEQPAGQVRRPEVEVLPAASQSRTRFWPMVGSALVWAARELLPEVISVWRTSRPEVSQVVSSTPATTGQRISVNRHKGHRHRWGRA